MGLRPRRHPSPNGKARTLRKACTRTSHRRLSNGRLFLPGALNGPLRRFSTVPYLTPYPLPQNSVAVPLRPCKCHNHTYRKLNMRNNLPTGGNSLPGINQFTVKHVSHVKQRMSLSDWLYSVYENSLWPFETNYKTLTITIDAKQPENLDIYYETTQGGWNIIWMQ
jgi:hypothetical protein